MSAYWQLPLHPDSYQACGIVTPKKVVASKRVLPGLANATSYFQSTVEPLFRELRDNMKAWLDDFNLHADSEAKLLHLLERFFQLCAEYNLYLSAQKCVLFAREIRWCGRIIAHDGYTLDPSRLSGLKEMSLPTTAAEMGEFIYCCRWMSLSIPEFSRRVSPLVSALEATYSRSGKRTKRSIKHIALSSLSWGAIHEQKFRNLQNTLQNAAKLSYPKPGIATCVYTDAWERFWAGIVTQTNPKHLDLPLNEQRHEPLAFLGSEFRNAELGWSTFEKEGYAIFQTFEKWTICS